MSPSRLVETERCMDRQRGFTLLEVLVGFVLLSLTLGVILQIFSGGLRNTAAAGHYTQAAILADSKLALVGVQIPLLAGEQSGEEGDYGWRMTIAPYHDAEEADNPTNDRHQLYAITLWVEWQHGARKPELRFDTYRLGTPDGS